MLVTRAIYRGGKIGFGKTIPPSEVPFKTLPNDTFRDAAPGGGCDNDPPGFIPTALPCLGEHDPCGVSPTPISRDQHPQPVANGLQPAEAA
jgi:hypothetical protein